MTGTPTIDRGVSFLQIRYSPVSFLVNQNQIAAGVHPGREKPVSSFLKYCNSTMDYQGQELALLDLDGYLNDTYGATNSAENGLAIVCDLGPHAAGIPSRLETWSQEVGLVSLSKRFMALKLKGTAETLTCPIREMKLLPPSLRTGCRKHGLLALRFGEEGEICYLLDLEGVIPECLETVNPGYERLQES